MTVKQVREFLKDLDENTLVFSSLFGKKLRNPNLSVVKAVKYDEEDCTWDAAGAIFERDGKPLPHIVFPVVKISC